MLNMNTIVGNYNFLWIVLDSLRFDSAEQSLQEGKTPYLKSILPNSKWEKRFTTGCFTYPAHHSFFAGFLPVLSQTEIQPRLFAADFSGSETINSNTFVFQESSLPEALKNKGYRTICIGGVGFFKKNNPLSKVLPDLFAESYWEEGFGVTHPESPQNQILKSLELIENHNSNQKIFLYLNISAIHQPNCIFLPGAVTDSVETQKAALSFVDSQLAFLFNAFRKRGPLFCIICSDHGTAYGEDGYYGHRFPHPVVMCVPYAHFTFPESK